MLKQITFVLLVLLLLSSSTFSTFMPLGVRLVGGGVQLDPLGAAATDWPIVPAPDDR
jgi:hypothetical protein